MKKILLILLSYIVLYKTYLIFQGELYIYIINPLAWFLFAIICKIFLCCKSKRVSKITNDVLSISTILSLLFVITYYSLGLFVGYTNNPYSTNINALIINFFSLWLVIALKEYIRYLFINIKIKKYKKIYLFILFLIFVISDINILSVMRFNTFLDVWAKELLIPIIMNLLMMYLVFVSNYKVSIVIRTIIMLPTLIFNVVPDYEWFMVMILYIYFCLSIYLILQYVIAHKSKDLPVRLIDTIEPRRWIVGLIVGLFVMAFSVGFFSIKPVVILTGSMQPIINPGDTAIIRKCNIDDIKVGDIVEYKLENYIVIHRVILIYYKSEKAYLITKGDANKNIDKKPVTGEQLVGKLEYNIPYIGYPAYFLRNMVNNKDVEVEQGGI